MKRIRNSIQPLFFTLTLICLSLSPSVKANFADDLQKEANETLAGKTPLTHDAWETAESFFDIHHTKITMEMMKTATEFSGLPEDAEASRTALATKFEGLKDQAATVQSVFLKAVRGLSGIAEEDATEWSRVGSSVVGHGLRLKKGAADTKAADYEAQAAVVATRLALLKQKIANAATEIDALKKVHTNSVDLKEQEHKAELATLTSTQQTALDKAAEAAKAELATLKETHEKEAARDAKALEGLTFSKAKTVQTNQMEKAAKVRKALYTAKVLETTKSLEAQGRKDAAALVAKKREHTAQLTELRDAHDKQLNTAAGIRATQDGLLGLDTAEHTRLTGIAALWRTHGKDLFTTASLGSALHVSHPFYWLDYQEDDAAAAKKAAPAANQDGAFILMPVTHSPAHLMQLLFPWQHGTQQAMKSRATQLLTAEELGAAQKLLKLARAIKSSRASTLATTVVEATPTISESTTVDTTEQSLVFFGPEPKLSENAGEEAQPAPAPTDTADSSATEETEEVVEPSAAPTITVDPPAAAEQSSTTQPETTSKSKKKRSKHKGRQHK